VSANCYSIEGEGKMEEKSKQNQGKRKKSEVSGPDEDGHTKQLKSEEQTVSS
jgi:hypothetical protein